MLVAFSHHSKTGSSIELMAANLPQVVTTDLVVTIHQPSQVVETGTATIAKQYS